MALVYLVEAAAVGVSQADEESAREDLTAVGVTGDLKPDAALCGSLEVRRLVCQKHRPALWIAALEREVEVVSLPPSLSAAAPVVDPDQADAAAVIADRHAPISQDCDADRFEKARPRDPARVVLVVAGDEVGAEARA